MGNGMAFSEKVCELESDTHSWISTISEVCADKRSIETTINKLFLGHTRLPHEFIFLRQPPLARAKCCGTLIVHHIFNTL